jgi:hypothetical protein
MNFYTDDSPGLKVPPVSWLCTASRFQPSSTVSHACLRLQVAVIVMSLAFILFVTVLHIIGKVRGQPAAP